MIRVTLNVFHLYLENNFWWKTHGPFLAVFEWNRATDDSPAEPREMASIDFSRLFGDKSLTISAVTTLRDTSYRIESSDHAFTLLIALNRESSGSFLCLFDAHDSRVIKSIECQFKVSCLACVSGCQASRRGPQIFSEEISIMDGVIAVGTQGGLVFLVDLCLDQQNDAALDVIPAKAITFIVKQSSFSNSNNYDLQMKRKSSLINDQHIALPLNNESQQKGRYIYRAVEGKILTAFRSSEVVVTALEYVPQTNSLYVGYNFGGFQFWNLKSLELECSCSLEGNTPPVIGFSYQEPENDPKDFCYLWVCRGKNTGDCAHRSSDQNDASISSAYLYLLEYSKKEWIPGHGYLYSGHQSTTCKFDYQMGLDPYSSVAAPTTSSNIICLYTIEQGQLSFSDPNDDQNHSQDLSLCFFVWEAWDEFSNISSCVYIAIFDLNQWYRAQMPVRVENPSSSSVSCPYLGIFSLTEVADSLTPDAILSLRLVSHIEGHPVSMFRRDLEEESSYLPCSYSFDVDVLSEGQLLNISFLGVQRKCLNMLIKTSHDVLIDPNEFISSCCQAWLISMEEASKLDSIESKRRAILSLALKYDHLPTLIKLIERWASGEWTKIGCDCRFILNWIWGEVGRVKTSIDELTHCLFDGSDDKLSEPDYVLLTSYVSTLKSLEILVHKLAQNGTLSTEQGLLELDGRREAIGLIITYLKVILWLHDCGLIPENFDDFEDIDHEENVPTIRGIYPRTHLSKAYRDLRCQLHTLNPVSLGLTDSLLIDGITNLFEDSLRSARPCEDGSNEPFYPPPYIHSIVCIYLIDSIPLDVKHMIMQYFLLDLCSCPDVKASGMAEKIKLFPLFFGLRPGLVQLIEGFWSIDNKHFDSGLEALSSPQVRNIMKSSNILDETMKSLMDDLQRRLANSLLYRDRPRLALEIICQLGLFDINSSEKERLYTSILLRNGQLMKAFSFQRNRRTHENTEETLLNFFICCENMNLMSKLFQFPLDKIEEDGLIYYLSHVSTSKNSKHFLLLFLLLNGKIIEACQFREAFHEELLADEDGRPNPTGIHISAIIDAFFANLPGALVEIANDVHRHKSTEILERTPSAKIQAQKGAIDITAPSISPEVNICVDTVLKIVEDIEETTKDMDVENCPHSLSTPFQQK